jgi:hypothetical protein
METELQGEVVRRGLHFCGVLGTFNGVPRSAFAEPLDSDSVISIAQAYLACIPQAEINRLAERIYAKVDPPKPNYFTDFMARIHPLPDTRDYAEPLFLVERDWKAAHAVQKEPAFLSHVQSKGRACLCS